LFTYFTNKADGIVDLRYNEYIHLWALYIAHLVLA